MKEGVGVSGIKIKICMGTKQRHSPFLLFICFFFLFFFLSFFSYGDRWKETKQWYEVIAAFSRTHKCYVGVKELVTWNITKLQPFQSSSSFSCSHLHKTVFFILFTWFLISFLLLHLSFFQKVKIRCHPLASFYS